MIKTIIFDFDNTIYLNADLSDYDEYIREGLKKQLKTDENVERFYKKYSFSKAPHVKDIVLALENEGLSAKKYYRYEQKTAYTHRGLAKDVLPNEFFEALSQKFNLYCLSLSTQKYLKHHFNLYDIDKKNFKKIYSSDFTKKGNCKFFDMIKIRKRERVEFEEMLMIGDSFVSDIQPALDLGINAFHFNQENFDQIYDYLTKNNILNCERFKQK